MIVRGRGTSTLPQPPSFKTGWVMKRHQKKGFTLIEILLVLIILGILSVAGISIFGHVADTKTEAAARMLASDIIYARSLARSRNAIFGIAFDTTTSSYTVHLFDPATNTETPVTNPTTQTPMVVHVSQLPAFSGVTLSNANFGGTAKVRFLPQGTPQNGAGVNLVDQGSIIVSQAQVTRMVRIQPETGEVSLP